MLICWAWNLSHFKHEVQFIERLLKMVQLWWLTVLFHLRCERIVVHSKFNTKTKDLKFMIVHPTYSLETEVPLLILVLYLFWVLWCVHSFGQVSLLTENGNTKDDLRLPTDESLLNQVHILDEEKKLRSLFSSFHISEQCSRLL